MIIVITSLVLASRNSDEMVLFQGWNNDLGCCQRAVDNDIAGEQAQ
jgi:hypothetical protein